MKKLTVTRDTSYPYAQLNLLFNTKLIFVQRDAETMAKYKITKINLPELQILADQFYGIVSDTEMIVQQKDATLAKNEAFDKLLANLYFLKAVMQNSISAKELRNLAPSIFKLSSLSDAEILVTANATQHVAVLYSDLLADWGVSEEFHTQFEALIQDCKTKLFATGGLKSQRALSTTVRHETANKVTAALQQICKIGRVVWILEKNMNKQNGT